MPKPVNHSQLAEFLKKQHLDLLIFTSGGVIEEGGPLVSDQATDGESALPQLPPETGFKFSKSSQFELQGVNPDLVECVSLALFYYTPVDFRVFDGIRTVEEQRRHVNNGTSKTMKSKHLDGLAVDLVPIIGGVLKWDWDGCYQIAMAMDKAATRLGIADRITWGGAWDRTLADFGGDSAAYRAEVEAYKRRHAGPDFIDGPHFEIRPA